MKEEHSYPSTKSASSSVPSNSVIIAVDKPEMLVTCFNSLSWATKRDGFSKPMSGALTLSQRSLQFTESLLQWLAHRFLKTAAVQCRQQIGVNRSAMGVCWLNSWPCDGDSVNSSRSSCLTATWANAIWGCRLQASSRWRWISRRSHQELTK